VVSSRNMYALCCLVVKDIQGYLTDTCISFVMAREDMDRGERKEGALEQHFLLRLFEPCP
jgi:hypothetical protein